METNGTVTQALDNSTAQTTVAVIAARPASRAGLRLVLETEPGVFVVGEASSVTEGLEVTRVHTPHVVILDLELAGSDAAVTTRELAAQFAACIIVLIALLDPATHAELLAAGAAACVEKDLPANLLKAFREVRQRS